MVVLRTRIPLQLRSRSGYDPDWQSVDQIPETPSPRWVTSEGFVFVLVIGDMESKPIPGGS